MESNKTDFQKYFEYYHEPKNSREFNVNWNSHLPDLTKNFPQKRWYPEQWDFFALSARWREFSMLASSKEERKNISTRNRRIHSSTSWVFYWDYFAIARDEKFYNFYISVARYHHGVPDANSGAPQKKCPERDIAIGKWNQTAWKDIIDYDFLIDIDAESHDYTMVAHEIARKCILECKARGWKNLTVLFSGMGFHILVREKELLSEEQKIKVLERLYDPGQFDGKENIYEAYQRIAAIFHKKFSIPKKAYIDMNIYDHKRLMKLPMSLACYDDRLCIVYPFRTMEEFLNFRLEDYTLPMFMENAALHYKLPLITKIDEGGDNHG